MKKKKQTFLERIRLAKKADGTLASKTSRTLIALQSVYGDMCLCCLAVESDTIDHVVPKSKNGQNHPDNYQPLCSRCNNKKGDLYVDYRPDDEKLRERVRNMLGVNRSGVPAPNLQRTIYMDMPKNLDVRPKKLSGLHPYWNIRTKQYEYYTLEPNPVPDHLVKPIFAIESKI